MTPLGPGMRVWIGWCPASDCRPGTEVVRCSLGMITEGPLHAGDLWRDIRVRWRSWIVRPDSAAETLAVAEHLLHPLDDGEPETVEMEREVTA